MKLVSLFTITTLLVLGACYYDNEEFLYPGINAECDTTQVTFSITIQPLLTNNCYSCHSNNTAPVFGNNLALENYTDVKNNASAILGSVKHDENYIPMPENGGRISSCFITQIELWIGNGMPEN